MFTRLIIGGNAELSSGGMHLSQARSADLQVGQPMSDQKVIPAPLNYPDAL